MLAVQPYGICIVLGIAVAYCIFYFRFILSSVITNQLALRMISSFLWAGLIGARLFYYIELLYTQQTLASLFAINKGGISSQGAIIGILFMSSFFIYRHGTKSIKIIDCIASCAPLVQAIARIGCLIAGCCYGIHTTAVWAITYTDKSSLAPTNIPLHPTQLYSALLLLCFFFIIQFTLPTLFKYTGLTTAIYLFLSSLERFMIDFLRGDRLLVIYALSPSQWAALACGTIALTIIALCLRNKPSTYECISKN